MLGSYRIRKKEGVVRDHNDQKDASVLWVLLLAGALGLQVGVLFLFLQEIGEREREIFAASVVLACNVSLFLGLRPDLPAQIHSDLM